jgi:hypothetical protein
VAKGEAPLGDPPRVPKGEAEDPDMAPNLLLANMEEPDEEPKRFTPVPEAEAKGLADEVLEKPEFSGS